MDFKTAFRRLAPLFAVLTVCMHVYVWLKYQSVLAFLHNMFLHLAPLLAAHVYLAFLASRNHTIATGGEYVEEDGDDGDDVLWVNPGTGSPMIGGIGGIDTSGYTYGSGPSHSDE
jgi:hypothetical protein